MIKATTTSASGLRTLYPNYINWRTAKSQPWLPTDHCAAPISEANNHWPLL